MKSSFTLQDFFLLCRNETDESGEHLFDDQDSFESVLIDKFSGSTNQSLKLMVPDKKIINNILGYSHALCLVKTSDAGNFEIMLN